MDFETVDTYIENSPENFTFFTAISALGLYMAETKLHSPQTQLISKVCKTYLCTFYLE
jgi:hypothetical protein